MKKTIWIAALLFVAGTAYAQLSGTYGLQETGLPLGGGTLTGSLVTKAHSFSSTTTLAPSGTTQTVDWSLGNIQFMDLENASGNVTVTFSNLVNNQRVLFVVQQGTANQRTVTITSAKYQGGVAAVMTAVADAIDTWDCSYVGSVIRCDHGSDYR